MKKQLIKISLICLIAIASGCSKQLDIEPITSVDASNALQTGGDVQGALIGAYATLGGQNFLGGRIFVMSELLADYDELIWSGTFQGMTQIYNKQITVDNGFATASWLAGYSTINTANTVLNSLNLVAAASKNSVEGQAKFIRAISYFQLVKMYAKDWSNGNPATNDGVPLVLTPIKLFSEADKVPRAKVAAIYAQIIQDLTDAEAKLGNVPSAANAKYLASKQSAAAMLARVYLQQRDYPKARDAANRVIASNRFDLVTYFPDVFPYNDAQPFQNSREVIFSLAVSVTQGINDFQTFFSADGRGDITIDAPHFNLYESGDERLDLFYSSGGSDYTGKNDNVYSNVQIIRLAEMYLIRAESNFRLGTNVGADPLDDINTIRGRVFLPALGSISNLDQILYERKLELAFEGFNLDDIKRLGVSTGYFSAGPGVGLAHTSPKLVLPIPDRERRVNPNLTQNDGY
jgi:starch-binding outer membrane protein, SusD/RagB family